METPIYDSVKSDLDIDPQEQTGHDERTAAIVTSAPSKILAKEPEGGDEDGEG